MLGRIAPSILLHNLMALTYTPTRTLRVTVRPSPRWLSEDSGSRCEAGQSRSLRSAPKPMVDKKDPPATCRCLDASTHTCMYIYNYIYTYIYIIFVYLSFLFMYIYLCKPRSRLDPTKLAVLLHHATIGHFQEGTFHLRIMCIYILYIDYATKIECITILYMFAHP